MIFSGVSPYHSPSTPRQKMKLPRGLTPLVERPRRNARWVFQAALLVSLALLTALPARAQDKKDNADLRTVHGIVVDKDENPVASSLVYLLNVKTKTVDTRISDDAGNFSFSRLDPNVDYEIHAEHDDLMSAVRTISSYDTRTDVEIILKLSHQKPAN
ncbi:MAG: carboxypeptidase-like regulatory domain-containing protein [Candidatus Acidiferrales bacterium]